MLNLWTLSKWASTDHQCCTEISISCWRRKTVISILLPDWSDSTSHWSDGVSDKVTWLLKNHRRRPDFPIYDRIQFISIVFFIGWNHKAALQGLATTCLSVSRLPPPPPFRRRSLIVQLFITNQQNPPFLQSSLSGCNWYQIIVQRDYPIEVQNARSKSSESETTCLFFYVSPFQASVSLI